MFSLSLFRSSLLFADTSLWYDSTSTTITQLPKTDNDTNKQTNKPNEHKWNHNKNHTRKSVVVVPCTLRCIELARASSRSNKWIDDTGHTHTITFCLCDYLIFRWKIIKEFLLCVYCVGLCMRPLTNKNLEQRHAHTSFPFRHQQQENKIRQSSSCNTPISLERLKRSAPPHRTQFDLIFSFGPAKTQHGTKCARET